MMQSLAMLTTAALAAVLLLGDCTSESSLSEALSKATFYHNGTAHASDGKLARLKVSRDSLSSQ